MLKLPQFKAAAVQGAPVFLDTDARVDKGRWSVQGVAENGTHLVALPGELVAGYRYWRST